MRPTYMRSIAAIATMIAGVLIGSLHRYTQQRPATVQPVASTASTPPVSIDEGSYPEKLNTNPFTIVDYVRDHPNVKLDKLWQRLGITGDDPYDFMQACRSCEVNIFRYNLDTDFAIELLVQIKEQFAESYRYLIFKGLPRGEAKFLGHIDVYAKYTPADPVVLMSNGRPWLIVQQTAATGSGLGAWSDTVYELSNGRVRPVASYLASVTQSGELGFPWKEFVARPVSCEIEGGHSLLTLSTTVEYKARYDDDVPLFTKQQKIALRGSLRDGSSVLDATRSEVVPEEFDTIYNFDNMGQREFLKYNRQELRAIATGDDSEKKLWLRDFLATCRNSSIKRELSRFLN